VATRSGSLQYLLEQGATRGAWRVPVSIGFGCFYNYFDSKDAIVAAVIEDAAEAAAQAIDAATSDLDDAAEVAARPLPEVPQLRSAAPAQAR
jgi:DNA-binding transcriptional regulator YbjK